MKSIIGIVLIVLSLILGYLGITNFSASGESVDILGIELSAQDNDQRTTAFIYMGFAAISFLGGLFLVKKK